jgi:hypothetical protein
MPYAYKDKLTQSPIEGGIEITQEQYQDAIKAKCEGKFVAIYEGVLQELENSKQKIYSKEDGSKKEISILDEVPDTHTTLKRPSEFHKFEKDGWVLDEVAKKKDEAKNRITELQQKLRDTDYVTLSDYDQDKPEIIADRQAWRDEIRQLEQTL